MGIISRMFAAKPLPHDPAREVLRALAIANPHRERLDLLRMAYICQVIHVGRHGVELFPDRFMATTMGNYNARLSQLARFPHMLRRGGPPRIDALASATIRDVTEATLAFASGGLLSICARPGGAWRSLWRPDEFSMRPVCDPDRWNLPRQPTDVGPVIGIGHMKAEYLAMQASAAESSK